MNAAMDAVLDMTQDEANQLIGWLAGAEPELVLRELARMREFEGREQE